MKSTISASSSGSRGESGWASWSTRSGPTKAAPLAAQQKRQKTLVLQRKAGHVGKFDQVGAVFVVVAVRDREADFVQRGGPVQPLRHFLVGFRLERGVGQVKIVTPSGTNQFHGSAYEFLRNSVFDSNNWFENRAGRELGSFKRSQFGERHRGDPLQCRG